MSSPSTQFSTSQDHYSELRAEMVEVQIHRRGLRDENVLRVLSAVPRHEFVLAEWRARSYDDEPLPIGEGQTISQPYIVAVMTAALQIHGGEKVLEIGTGCGYQAAVLAGLAQQVYTVECRPGLACAARERLQRLGYRNVHVHCGDGGMGLAEFAPYDAILVAAGAPSLPKPLLQQLAARGRLIAPVGAEDHQELLLVTWDGASYTVEHREGCRFVPLQGQFGWQGRWSAL
jgi:protein-L-isoaspartate(D-aspartate) O-methyltransferase